MRHPKPAVSAWIVAERKRLGWKVEELSERLVDLGYDAQVSTVRVWEAGRSPKPETIEALETLFGSQAPREPAAMDQQRLFDLMVEQTAAINRSAQAQEQVAAKLDELLARLVIDRKELNDGLVAMARELAAGGPPSPATPPDVSESADPALSGNGHS